jgi:PTS system mannose-specific IIB component
MTAPRTTHCRIDDRLLHGQIVQFWIPHLGVERLFIADDDAAENVALLDVFRAAIPEGMTLRAVPVDDLPRELTLDAGGPTLVLFAEVRAVARARAAGFIPSRVVIGNVHAGPGRLRMTDAVHLSPPELAVLADLRQRGTEVEIQTLPGETLRLAVDEDGVPLWSKS